MTVQVKGQKVTLSGTVGDDWFGDGFTHAHVVAALADLDGDIKVHLNSGGGIASEGAAIYSTLASYNGRVDIVIEGIAASAASLIAMAGETVTMADGAVMMIHDPMNITVGNSAEHAKTIEELEVYAKSYAKIYAKKSGKTANDCRDIMRAETWFDGDQAVEAGFADEAGASKARPVAAYDYRAYAHAPKGFVAQAKAKDWSIAKYVNHDDKPPTAASVAKDEDMTDKERADALAAELATLKAEKAKIESDFATASASAAQATAEALKADRDRRAAIMALPEAKGREALAEVLFADGANVEKAKAFLGAAPEAVAPSTTAEDYEKARLAGADLSNGGKSDDKKASWASAVSRANKRNGKK
jgi:ATP-dependent protease ClpP protease subunit